MYIPPHFKEEDMQVIERLVREFSFATLVSVVDGKPWATHLPLSLEIDEGSNWTLSGHVARANPQWKNLETSPGVMAIFMGPHTYISPSWYNHRNVPTWNYQAAHLYGTVRILTGEELELELAKMMQHYESAHAGSPLEYKDIPDKILQPDLRALVGFKIRVEKIEAASKLSQNRDAESYQSVMDHLKEMNAYDAARIAEEMEKRKK